MRRQSSKNCGYVTRVAACSQVLRVSMAFLRFPPSQVSLRPGFSLVWLSRASYVGLSYPAAAVFLGHALTIGRKKGGETWLILNGGSEVVLKTPVRFVG